MRAPVAMGLAAALALVSLVARAQKPAPPDERRDANSPYERKSIEIALAKVGGAVDPSPEGKIVEGFEVVTLDVFEKRDPLPGFLMRFANFFHVTTKRYVIEREVLLRPGQRWSQALIDETARNLRGLPQLSLVLAVPLKGSAPDRVKLLVITKDVWSLRLNENFTFENGRLQYLLLQPSEENLAGSHQQVYGNFVYDPAVVQVGGIYVIPRLDGSRVGLSAQANAIVNHLTGKAEGSSGSFSYGQPLYATTAEWAWNGTISWDEETTRRFVGGQFTAYDPASGTCQPIKAGVTPDAPGGCHYRTDALTGSFTVTRSWGSLHKHDLTVGVGARRRLYSANDLPAAQAGYRSLMPLSDTQIGPFVEYHDYSTRFMDVLDVETMALTENFRRGHEIFVHVAPITTALRSTRDFISVFAGAAYTVPLGDGFVRGIVQANTEIGTAKDPPPAQGRIPDGNVEAGLRIVTPRFGIGRLMFDTHVLDRYRDYVNALTTLGGDTRLRGYQSGSFIGKDWFAANLEYRSRPLEVFSVDADGAIFFDTGDAFPDFGKIRLKHSVGFGARVEFPQLDRTVLRVDWGFPLTLGKGLPGDAGLPTKVWPGDVVVTFGQAFAIPQIPPAVSISN